MQSCQAKARRSDALFWVHKLTAMAAALREDSDMGDLAKDLDSTAEDLSLTWVFKDPHEKKIWELVNIACKTFEVYGFADRALKALKLKRKRSEGDHEGEGAIAVSSSDET